MRKRVRLTRDDQQLLQMRRDAVLARCKRLLEDIAYYEEAFDSAGVKERLQLKSEIGRLKIEFDEAKAELHETEQKLQLSPGELLREALCNLNYHEQVDLFQEAIRKSWVLSFLMHGKWEYGHPWLLYRFEKKLLAHQGKMCQTEKLRFDLSSQFSERSIDGLWRRLGVRAGIRISPFAQYIDKDAIVARVRAWLKTKNVVLIFNNLDDMNNDEMEQLIQNFWQPLIERVRNLPGQSTSNYLLMFLVDERGCVHKWNFHCVDGIGEGWKAGDPIKLSELTEFTDEAIADWIVKEGKRWPNLFEEDRPRVQDIMAYSNNGVPQGVLEYICSLCGCRWDEEEGWVVYDQQFA